jgi:hypothetical protein
MGTKRRGRGARWLGFAVFLAGMVLVFWHFAPGREPVEVALNSPVVLVERLSLPNEPDGLRWSPEGTFLGVLSRHHRAEVAIIDTTTAKLVGRVDAEWEALRGAQWASDSRLWVPSGRRWVVHAPPFGQGTAGRVSMPAGFSSYPAYRTAHHPDGALVASIRERTSLEGAGRRGEMRLVVWRGEQRHFDIPFKPRHHRGAAGSREASNPRFSPDGARMAFAVEGSLGPDEPAPGELWVLDTASGQLDLLHVGASRWWEIFDYPVQRVDPSWTPDGREVVFGDSTFGVEAIDVVTRRRRRILPPKWGLEPLAGRDWVAFEESWQRPGIRNAPGVRPSIAVVSRDGRWWGRMRGEYDGWRALAWAWDRAGERLALVGEGADGYQVLIWRVQRL